VLHWERIRWGRKMNEASRALTRAMEGRPTCRHSELFTYHVINLQPFIGRSDGSRFRGDVAQKFLKKFLRLSLYRMCFFSVCIQLWPAASREWLKLNCLPSTYLRWDWRLFLPSIYHSVVNLLPRILSSCLVRQQISSRILSSCQ
jgi:hypothetical protein